MIGVFDSGFGGISVLSCLIKALPKAQFLYYSDSFNNPYGDKSEEELYIIVKRIVDYLIDRGCLIIVVACNTASALCIRRLREEYTIPFIAIEPAIKMVYDNNPAGKTLVMATKGTIVSEKFLALYHKYHTDNMILLSCNSLASLIEDGDYDKINNYLNEVIAPYRGVDNVVLGCTHYPLIKSNIRNVLGEVKFFDGSVGVSKELLRQIELKNIKLNFLDNYFIEFVDSSKDNFLKRKERFFKLLKENN